MEIKTLTLDCKTILPQELLDDKLGILDIKAILNDNTNCDIEMQIVDKKNIEKRLMYYWSKMYIQEFKSGIDYKFLNKTIVILFADYELDSLKNIPKILTKWQLREEEYVKFILTNILEIYILELPKFEKYKDNFPKNELNLWINFIKNPGVINLKETNIKEIKKAKEVLEEISKDGRERYLAELREKYIADQKAVEDNGFDKGLKQGMQQGIEQGTQREKIEIAKKLLSANIDIQIIINSTGLSKEEVENLK